MHTRDPVISMVITLFIGGYRGLTPAYNVEVSGYKGIEPSLLAFSFLSLNNWIN